MQVASNKTPGPASTKKPDADEEAVKALERLDRLLKRESPNGPDGKVLNLKEDMLVQLKKMIPNTVWMIS